MSTSEADYRWLGIDVSKDRLDVYDPSQSLKLALLGSWCPFCFSRYAWISTVNVRRAL
jgi:hypothetical protein